MCIKLKRKLRTAVWTRTLNRVTDQNLKRTFFRWPEPPTGTKITKCFEWARDWIRDGYQDKSVFINFNNEPNGSNLTNKLRFHRSLNAYRSLKSVRSWVLKYASGKLNLKQPSNRGWTFGWVFLLLIL